jgi:fatty-acyl-CoA synthase
MLFVFGNVYEDDIGKLNLSTYLPLMKLATVGKQSGFSGTLNYISETAAFQDQNPLFKESSGPTDPEEPHVIMYTSGTTGQPKGAVLSHRKTFFNCLNADIFFKLHFDDIMLIVLPLFHSGGLFIQASPIMYKGATMIIHPKFDPYKVYQDIQQFKVTKFAAVPTIYKKLLEVKQNERGDISSLEVCLIGGEKATPKILAQCQEAGLALRQILGQTETSIFSWASEEESLRKPGTVGRPVFHSEIAVVDETGHPVRPDTTGEIVIRGPILMNEYWQDPVLTSETIKSGWHHTGDLGRMDKEGYLYLVDRAKNMYISGGENVYPAEVEGILGKHPDIKEVAVVGVPDETWGEVGHAFVIPIPRSDLHPEDVILFCEGKLARYKWPKKLTFCHDFPRTSMGKVRKSLLNKEDEENPPFIMSGTKRMS